MRRIPACVFVLLGVGLLLAPAQALAATAAGAAKAGPAAAGGVNFQPLGDATTQPISGVVRDYAGNGVAGAEVDWGWWTSLTAYQFGGTNISQATPSGTDASGAFNFADALGGHQVAGVAADDLHVYYYPTSPGLEEMAAFTLDFATNNDNTLPSPYTYVMQPAHVNIEVANAPATSFVEVRAGNSNVGYAAADVPLNSGVGVASVLPMSNFDDVVAYSLHVVSPGVTTCLAQTEALASTPVDLTAGTTAADTVNLDWSKAQQAYLAGPTFKHSGAPGTAVKMILKGWPATEKAAFVADYGASPYLYGASQTSSGADITYTVPLTVRKNAPVDVYPIETYRADNLDSLVALWDYFQVCTFKPSASAIHHGKTVRLSGKVPGSGYVTVYSTSKKVSGQPATLSAKGWVKGGRYHIASSGKFQSALLHPKRTTWYVAKYTGWAFPAFTSVVKVTVR
jgi:hypothetical protein